MGSRKMLMTTAMVALLALPLAACSSTAKIRSSRLCTAAGGTYRQHVRPGHAGEPEDRHADVPCARRHVHHRARHVRDGRRQVAAPDPSIVHPPGASSPGGRRFPVRREMKFGLGLSVQHSPDDSQAGRFQEHLEQVRLASAVGFDSVWASQHYLSAPFSYFQPLPVARSRRRRGRHDVPRHRCPSASPAPSGRRRRAARDPRCHLRRSIHFRRRPRLPRRRESRARTGSASERVGRLDGGARDHRAAVDGRARELRRAVSSARRRPHLHAARSRARARRSGWPPTRTPASSAPPAWATRGS